MSSPTDINGGPRRTSRIPVQKVVPKWIPLHPPTPVDLAEMQHRMSLRENRRGPLLSAPAPFESVAEGLPQSYEGYPDWRGTVSAANPQSPYATGSFHGTPLPSRPSPSVFGSPVVPVHASFPPGFQPHGPPAPASFHLGVAPQFSASMVPGQGFQDPRQPGPDNSFPGSSIESCSFLPNPAQPPASGFTPYHHPERRNQHPRPPLAGDSFRRFAARGPSQQFQQGCPGEGFPYGPRSFVAEESYQLGAQDLTEAPLSECVFQENASLSALSAARSGVESPWFSSRDQALGWSGEGAFPDEERSTAEAVAMAEHMREPGGNLHSVTMDEAGHDAMQSKGIPSTDSADGFKPDQQEDILLGYAAESVLEETDQDKLATIGPDRRNNFSLTPAHQNEMHKRPRIHPWSSAEEGGAEDELGHSSTLKEYPQQAESERVQDRVDEVQPGSNDEEAPISFDKRLSDPYALKDLSRWRPKDYEDYPELKRIQTEYGEKLLGKPRSQALIPILKARQRIRMAESHHEERKQHREIDIVERLNNFCMRLLRRKGASTGGYGNSGPWAKHLREIEGQFGSAIMLTFAFLQWSFLFNCILSILWLVMIIIPFCILPPKSFSWQQFSHAGLGGLLQTNGVDLTFILYGGYSYVEGEKHGMAELYAVTILLMLVASFFAVASRMIQNLQTGRFESAYKITTAYPFSTIAFTSWDFHITSHDSATALRRTIRMEMRQMLADVKDPPIEGVLRNIFLTRQRYLALLVFWPVVHATSVGITILLAVKDWGINRKLGTNLAQSAILATIHILGSFITKYLVRLENWRPLTAEHVLGFKLFALRMGYLVALFSRLFIMMNNAQHHFEGKVPYAPCGSDGSCTVSGYVCCNSTTTTLPWANVMNGTILTKIDSITKKSVPLQQCVAAQVGRCIPSCVENAVGKQLLRLVFTSVLIQNGIRIFLGYFKVYVLKLKVVMDIEDIALGVVYTQALVWVGSCFSPAAPFLAVFYVVVTFYSEKLILLGTCDPAGRQYSVSRSSNVTYGLLTVTLFGCTFAVAVVLWNRSGPCGPVPTHSLSEAFDIPLEKLPNAVGLLLRWATSGFLWGSLLCLSVVGYFLQRVKLRRASQSLWVTQQELDAQYQKYSALVLGQKAQMVSSQGPRTQPLFEEEEGDLDPFLVDLNKAGPLPSTVEQRQERFRQSLNGKEREARTRHERTYYM